MMTVVTYSIVARDPVTGDLGVAVQSHWFAAGDLVMWARSGAGAVATQATVEVSYGPLGLERMADGSSPADAINALTAADADAPVRQVAMVDAAGRVAAHTGTNTIRMAGHRTGEGFSVQANMMGSDTVWDAMADAFERAEGDLAHRMLDALDAAEAEGGDIRGRQAAGILVVRAEPTEQPWTDTLLNARVDDHDAPLPELRRIVDLKAAYDRMERAEGLELLHDVEGAFLERRAACEACPDNPEIAFWTAISLATAGRLDEAKRTIRVATAANAGWIELLRRMVQDDQVELSADALRTLMSPGPP
jgi:uncharacterized Ntn-hydrolase superfamily protein